MLNRFVAGAALALCGLVGVGAAGWAGSGGGAAPRLPNLDQAAPSHVSVGRARVAGRVRYRLAFRSAVENRGPGDLLVVARRPSARQSFLVADQYVDLVEPGSARVAAQRVVRAVGRLSYVRERDHRHFHFAGLERYELRRASDGRLAARDRKTGFCLGDRYEVGGRGARRTAAFGRGAGAVRLITRAHFDQDCGRDQPRLLRVVEGISVGYGDDYKPFLEGQFIDITAVPAGRYLLVHRSNVERRIEEADYRDNAASVLLAISRPGGRPGVRVLRTCPGTARCPAIG